ncbi:magnesium transporter CorA family protein [Futiania mangrovi]|uniref:Magnesium transport protein CorA n=1 Tax=Futiania mangrovi TaxID=2959716 RepID=A0A9J6PMX3_9PROT|nr:magnesium transporter CorA family protein [Futiania mangrovii]MCP1337418.1 magnesium transporter CorA family protein [Futiania mangrovii]
MSAAHHKDPPPPAPLLTAYRPAGEGLGGAAVTGGEVPEGTIWLDLLHPDAAMRGAASMWLGAPIPSHEDLAEIEFSSRLYAEGGTHYMTADVLAHADSPNPVLTPFTFILHGNRLVTVRTETPKAIPQFLARVSRPGNAPETAGETCLGLLEAITDRTADVLEHLSARIDTLHREVFVRRKDVRRRGRRLAAAVENIGREADLIAKVRESLVSQERLASFAGAVLAPPKGDHRTGAPLRERFKLLMRDIRSLEDHAGFLAGKTTFLLDATLGLISVEQNEVVRVLTVVAMAFFPPTLIGTVYGMNFDVMPELAWPWGYPLALLAMAASAVLPLAWFKHKGWL